VSSPLSDAPRPEYALGPRDSKGLLDLLFGPAQRPSAMEPDMPEFIRTSSNLALAAGPRGSGFLLSSLVMVAQLFGGRIRKPWRRRRKPSCGGVGDRMGRGDIQARGNAGLDPGSSSPLLAAVRAAYRDPLRRRSQGRVHPWGLERASSGRAFRAGT
jgi:hypothetical protein